MRKLVLIAYFFCVALSRQATDQTIECWVTHALVKVRPFDPVPRQPALSVMLYAARNEFEPFQVVLRTNASGVGGVDVQVSDFAGPGGAVLSGSNVTVYLEQYVTLSKASGIEGQPGEWPDPLVPRVDRYAGERRNAFPFTLRKDRNQPLWVEVYVPPDTPPGSYTGILKISADETPDISIPVRLGVWNATLPSTSSLPSTFGFNGVTALKQHLGRYTNDDHLHQITYLYAKAALLHRISIHGGSMAPPPFSLSGDGIEVDWARYDAEVGPFLDGTVLPHGDPLPGARATSAELRTPASLDTDRKKILYWREWARHFRRKGWFDRLFYYVWDEPEAGDYPKVFALASLARRADPGLRNLVTTPLEDQLAPVVDIWAPLINCFQSKPNFPNFCAQVVSRPAYQSNRQKEKGPWWYQSCGSHGCAGKGDEYFRGWPSYVIDISAVANRIMEWLTWKYRIHGELYFNMNEAYSRPDPWNDAYMHGGNGDGTLFYPGRRDKIGGASDIPIESIRLKLIREGLEDYEYFHLLSQMGAGDFADRWVQRVVQTPYLWERDPETFYAARKALGEKLNRVSGPNGTQDLLRRAAAADGIGR